MSKFSITSPDFEEGGEIPKKFGYKHGNETPRIELHIPLSLPLESVALIMDDPDAMAAVGKVWVHWLIRSTMMDPRLASVFDGKINIPTEKQLGFDKGKNDFGEIGYGGPAPPDGRHTYIFKAYALDTMPELKEGYSKQKLEHAMEGHILAEAKLTGTFTP